MTRLRMLCYPCAEDAAARPYPPGGSRFQVGHREAAGCADAMKNRLQRVTDETPLAGAARRGDVDAMPALVDDYKADPGAGHPNTGSRGSPWAHGVGSADVAERQRTRRVTWAQTATTDAGDTLPVSPLKSDTETAGILKHTVPFQQWPAMPPRKYGAKERPPAKYIVDVQMPAEVRGEVADLVAGSWYRAASGTTVSSPARAELWRVLYVLEKVWGPRRLSPGVKLALDLQPSSSSMRPPVAVRLSVPGETAGRNETVTRFGERWSIGRDDLSVVRQLAQRIGAPGLGDVVSLLQHPSRALTLLEEALEERRRINRWRVMSFDDLKVRESADAAVADAVGGLWFEMKCFLRIARRAADRAQRVDSLLCDTSQEPRQRIERAVGYLRMQRELDVLAERLARLAESEDGALAACTDLKECLKEPMLSALRGCIDALFEPPRQWPWQEKSWITADVVASLSAVEQERPEDVDVVALSQLCRRDEVDGACSGVQRSRA